jgi:hypothetical protein
MPFEAGLLQLSQALRMLLAERDLALQRPGVAVSEDRGDLVRGRTRGGARNL